MPFKRTSANKELKNGAVVFENRDPKAKITKITLLPYARKIVLEVNSLEAVTIFNQAGDAREVQFHPQVKTIQPSNPSKPTIMTFSWTGSQGEAETFLEFIDKIEALGADVVYRFLVKALSPGSTIDFKERIDQLLKQKDYDGIMSLVDAVKDYELPDAKEKLMDSLGGSYEKYELGEKYITKFIRDLNAQLMSTVDSKVENKTDNVAIDVKDSAPPKPKLDPEEIIKKGFVEAKKLVLLAGYELWIEFGKLLQTRGYFSQAMDAYNQVPSSAGPAYRSAQMEWANLYFNLWNQLDMPQQQATPKGEIKGLSPDEAEPLAAEEQEKIVYLQKALRHAANAEDQSLVSRIANSLVAPDILAGPLADTSYQLKTPITKANVELLIEMTDKERERNRMEMAQQPHEKVKEPSQAAAYAARGMLRQKKVTEQQQEPGPQKPPPRRYSYPK